MFLSYIGEPHSVVSVKEVADGKRGKVAQLSRDLYDKMKRCRAVEKEAWRKLSDYEDEVSGFCDEIDKESEALVCIAGCNLAHSYLRKT